MRGPRYCEYALKLHRDRRGDHFRYCRECQAIDAAVGLTEAHVAYARLHEYRRQNRVTKAARKRQKQARKANRSK